eukprot:351612-Chlamydomonas_euryale.AAC.26
MLQSRPSAVCTTPSTFFFLHEMQQKNSVPIGVPLLPGCDGRRDMLARSFTSWRAAVDTSLTAVSCGSSAMGWISKSGS